MLAANIKYFEVFFWPGGRAIGVVLWLMSIVTVALIIQFFLSIRRKNLLPTELLKQIKTMFSENKYREVMDITADEPSMLSRILHVSLCEASHGYPSMQRAMEEACEQKTTQLLRSIEWLHLIGNISPMLGLLGTVWGMINAFFTITQQKGAPEPSALASDIGIALVTTLLGLAIAIPSLACYSILRNRIDSISSETMVEAQELLATFKPSKKKQQ